MHGVCVLLDLQPEAGESRGKREEGEDTAQISDPAHLPPRVGMWGTPSQCETNGLGMIREWSTGDLTCLKTLLELWKLPAPTAAPPQAQPLPPAWLSSGWKQLCVFTAKGIYSQRNPNKRSDDPSGSLAGHLQPKLSSPTPSFPILPCHLARISCVGFFLLIQDQVKKV